MLTIPIEQLPQQSLSVTIDQHRYELELRELGTDMCMVTVTRDDVLLVSNVRAVSGRAILRYPYLVADIGNFTFITENGDYPHWSLFNTSQSLIYATAAEIAAVSDGT